MRRNTWRVCCEKNVAMLAFGGWCWRWCGVCGRDISWERV